MKALKRISIVVPALLLAASLLGVFLTRGAMVNLPFLRGKGALRPTADTLVDQRPWQTIEALAPLAVSVEEKRLAREAERLADHEVDQAFAQALRQATLDTHPLTGEALAAQQRVNSLKDVIKDDQAKVDSLTAAAKSAAPGAASTAADDLANAKAQLQLDNDELADASETVARLSGDHRDRIQRELAARQAAMKKFNEQAAATGPSALQSAKRYSTLAGRISAWFDQVSRMDSIQQAQAQAQADAASLTRERAAVETKLNSATAANGQDTQAKSRTARLATMHTLSQIHSILEDRIQTQQQLANVYGQWLAQVGRQHEIVLHLMLRSIAVIAFLLLCAGLINAIANKLLERLKVDRRTLHTLRTVATLGIQLLTLLLVVLAIFGVPTQMPTILGLATAGITVVFQDFILAFFGWFVLMGKNGIRVGDWVEINGVGGEVIEIGLFRTSLLETGNWTDRGHPTGRRVNFINNFAITGQYFNFSTSGQWLWDEITLSLPSAQRSYELIQSIHDVVQQETAGNAKQAEAEWKRASHQQGLSQFSAEPSVDLRPAGDGVEVVIRYVTRAVDRFNMRNRLYQAVMHLMHQEDKTLNAGEEQVPERV